MTVAVAPAPTPEEVAAISAAVAALMAQEAARVVVDPVPAAYRSRLAPRGDPPEGAAPAPLPES